MGRLDVIQNKLNALRAADRGLMVFGAEKHKHQLNPPVPASSLVEFEKEFGVALPDDFAAFLTQLGDGGAGPYYGLYPLKKIVAQLRRSQQYCRDRNLRPPDLVRRFPFTRDDALSVVGKAKSDLVVPEDDVALEGEVDGAIEICEYGCGGFFWLVVSGEQRGNVWSTDGCAWWPAAEDTSRMDFLWWYESELDRWLAPGAIERWASRFNRT